MTRKMLRNDKGDTLVEVLICIAILGFMIASAYALTTRNQTSTQKARERSEAVKLAETQLERLRAYADGHKLATIATGGIPLNYFCMVEDSSPTNSSKVTFVDFGVATPDTNIDTDASTAYPDSPHNTQCVKDFYQIAIWSAGVSSSGIGGDSTTKPFVVTVRWDSPGGGRDEVKMFYTVHDKASL